MARSWVVWCALALAGCKANTQANQDTGVEADTDADSDSDSDTEQTDTSDTDTGVNDTGDTAVNDTGVDDTGVNDTGNDTGVDDTGSDTGDTGDTGTVDTGDTGDTGIVDTGDTGDTGIVVPEPFSFPVLELPEGIAVAPDGFGSTPIGEHVVVAGQGFGLFATEDGTPGLSYTSAVLPYWQVALLTTVDGDGFLHEQFLGVGPNVAESGTWNGSNFGFVSPFGFTGIFTDAVAIPSQARALPGHSAGALAVNSTTGDVMVFTWFDDYFGAGQGFFADFANRVYGSDLTGTSGNAVSAAQPIAGGHMLVISSGAPGELWWVDYGAGRPFPISKVGDLGGDPRRIRCAPAGHPCAVSSYGSDELTLVDNRDPAAPVITGTVPVGDGPVGIDVGVNPDGGYVVASAGFGDNSLHLTEVDDTGTVVQDTSSTLSDCLSPGHAVFTSDMAWVAVSCNGSDTVRMVPTGW